jgi:hypothetical protein
MSPDLRGAAILDSDGAVLAASGRAERWRRTSPALLAVADAAEREPVEQVHIAHRAGRGLRAAPRGLPRSP